MNLITIIVCYNTIKDTFIGLIVTMRIQIYQSLKLSTLWTPKYHRILLTHVPNCKQQISVSIHIGLH